MKDHKMNREQMETFGGYLQREERSTGTIQKYLRDLERFYVWLDGRAVSKETAMAWKSQLLERGLRPTTINAMLAALNTFFEVLGWEECRVKPLRLQKRIFREQERELDQKEYFRLLEAARKRQDERLLLILQTICATGIRISELKFITAEAVELGRAEVNCKGKLRCILLPRKLQFALKRYCQKNGRKQGVVFLGQAGKPLSRTTIWRQMKSLCAEARVAPGKVFPHNLRHLFARTFYQMQHDIAKLADVLGHASIETTRIYIMESGQEHLKLVNQLPLLL